MALQVTLYVCMDKLFLFLVKQILHLVVALQMTFDLPTCVCSQGMFHPQFSCQVNEGNYRCSA